MIIVTVTIREQPNGQIVTSYIGQAYKHTAEEMEFAKLFRAAHDEMISKCMKEVIEQVVVDKDIKPESYEGN